METATLPIAKLKLRTTTSAPSSATPRARCARLLHPGVTGEVGRSGA